MADRDLKADEYEAAGVYTRMNKDTPDTGGKYIVLMMLASLGYVIADVAADGVVVAYAQREALDVRGRMQTAIYTVRTLFEVFAQVILGFGLSSPPYGGDFDFGISFPNVMLILAIFCLPVVPMTWFFISEEKYIETSFQRYLATLWEAIQSRVFYQVIAYNFFAHVLSGMTYVAYDPQTSYIVKATPFAINFSGILGSLVMAATLAWTGRSGLHWDWRKMIAITMVLVVALDALSTFLVTWDVVRNQWFWLGVPIVQYIPYGMNFIIATYVVVELAGEGNESAVYGLLTTVSNLGIPFASSLTKNINGAFDVWNADVINDTTHVRWQITYTLLIMYGMKLLSLALLPLLPKQKQATQELKKNGGSSKLMGGITICYCLFALGWSIMVNIFSIFKTTKCLKITGGCHH